LKDKLKEGHEEAVREDNEKIGEGVRQRDL